MSGGLALAGSLLYWFALPLPSLVRLLAISGHGSEALVTAVAWTSYAIGGSISLMLVVWYRGLSREQWQALLVGGVFLFGFLILFLVASATISYVARYSIEYFRVFIGAFVFLLLGGMLNLGPKQRWLMLLSYILVVVFAYFAIDFELMRVDFRDGYDGMEGHYLFVSDAICLIAACLVATIHRASLRILSIFATVLVVFFVGSRGSLWCFVAAALVMLSLSSKRMFVGTFLLFALGAFVVLPILEASDSPAVLRIMEPFTDHGGESGEARSLLFEAGLRAIGDHPFAGDLGGQIRALGSFGAYIHNILSFWRQFGFLGLIFIIVTLSIFVIGFRAVIKNQASGHGASFGVGLAVIFVVLASLTARSFASPFLWLLFGFMFREIGRSRVK
ncbi:hypothetical protein [Cupriavidus basilensis]|uniref:hypothetical protein n=1 Tax=Cupriavidus basilensis TaxID=68895 RepID=UPI0020A63B43|nr:hypothetical protein [Cupriavidus basilensis]MCP3019499.1 hypothetical protein [Cupriavidus basilensis]